LWRAQRGEKHILEQVTDPEVLRARRLAQAVRRDTHKMRAFLRFREVTDDGVTRHVGWFEPSHFIVEANAGFFVRRFASMQWSILTPYRSVHWDGKELRFAAGADPADVPDDDRLAEVWRVYFGAIFNPARLKPQAMRSEMPRKYWRNLPEAADIPEMIRTAPARAAAMVERAMLPAEPRRGPMHALPMHGLAMHALPMHALAGPAAVPEGGAAGAIDGCRRCGLWEHATQPVFGEGPADAAMMLVGEQPGDQEDLAGRPFVGPAGQMLDRALAEAGIDRAGVYVTNAVKHFKFEPRGRRRIHKSPDGGEIEACRFWLAQERATVRPKVTVLLGASAARAVMGRVVTISKLRLKPIIEADTTLMVTVHPSYLLRLPDEEAKLREYRDFVRDLRAAARLVG
jgi:uracil-DNA glycosylase family protein